MFSGAAYRQGSPIVLTQLQIRDIRLLQVFCGVVDAGGLTAAQDVLGMTQSNISTQILDLETRLGVVLCERGRAGFRVTPEGEQVYDTTAALLADLGDYQDRLQSIGHGLRGNLLIGHMDSYLSHPENQLVAALNALAQLSDNIYLNLRSATLKELELLLRSSTLQLAIGTFAHFQPEIDYHLLHTETQVLCCSSQHNLVKSTNPLRPTDVAQIGYAKGLFAYGEESSLLQNCVATAHQIEGMVTFILSGRGVGYIPDHVAKPWIDKEKISILLPQYFSRKLPVYLAVRKLSLVSPIVQRCVETLLEIHKS